MLVDQEDLLVRVEREDRELERAAGRGARVDGHVADADHDDRLAESDLCLSRSTYHAGQWLHEGRIQFDVSSEEKAALTVQEVVARFGRAGAGPREFKFLGSMIPQSEAPPRFCSSRRARRRS